MSRRSKERREDRLVHGDELLEKRGLDLEAPEEVLLPRLIAEIGADPDADLAIADLLGAINSQESADRLAAWERQNPPDKHLKRVIRQSLFRLGQHGVKVPEREVPVAERPRTVPLEEPVGHFSSIDGAGNRLAWLSRPRTEGGLFVLRALISDELGMRQVDALNLNRTQFREEVAGAARYGATMVEAPHRYVDWLMYEAHGQGVPREGGAGYPLLRAEIYDAPPEPVPSPAAETMKDFPQERESELRDASADLFGEREFAGWVIPEDLVKVHQARFTDAQDSTLVLNKEQMTERLTGVIDAAFAEVFGSAMRGRYEARMREMALWFALAGRAPQANLCWAVARALGDQGSRLEGVSFLRALVFRAFLHLIPRQEREPGKPADAPGSDEPGEKPLIVRP
jgi:hypothetical protein